MNLSELNKGESAKIVKVLGHGAFRKRVMEMGFVPGQTITAILSAPLNDPVKYAIMGYEVSLRRSEARLIEVEPINAESSASTPHTASANLSDMTETNDSEATVACNENSLGHDRIHTINVVLIGNPNCGKTSLFNIASGAQEHVGNYSGVTVGSTTGSCIHNGYHFNIVDLPGTYSLSAYSPEELYVRKYLRENCPDVIINVVAGSALERNLYLTTELIDMDLPMVIALNMADEMKAAGMELDADALGRMIGVPIVPTISRTGAGIPQLLDTVISVYERRNEAVRHVHVKLGHDLEDAIRPINDAIKADHAIDLHYSPRYLAIKLLEGDAEAINIVKESPNADKILKISNAEQVRINSMHPDEDAAQMIAANKYGFIAGALAETLKQTKREKADISHYIDLIVTSRVAGFPLFIAVMIFIFWVTFYIGKFPQEWIESLVAVIADFVSKYMSEGPLKSLIVNGIIGGVGGVIVFLPNILILFFFLSLMEDTGYMARAAFIMDRLMHRIGLHGKSFIPMVMGFGCNVPAVMAARTIESRSSRAITVLITPFMSCSARLPVYVLLIGTFFEPQAALVFFGMYAIGVLAAIITARLLRRLHYKKDETPFVMELPPYRIPTFRTSLRHMWGKGKQYLNKMGGIILLASIIVWALDYFPLRDNTPIEQSQALTEQSDEASPERLSYLQQMGKAVNPVMEPIGFTWRATVAAIAGIPAKEIVVSTLGVLYTGSDEATDQTLSERLTTPLIGKDKPDFNHANALSFMVFILLYCPCAATVVAIVKETHSIGSGIFTMVYNTLLAWVMAFIIYHIALLF